MFDGQSLNGWRAADASYWSVEDGAITGQITPKNPCTVNQYLVWEGGELADFDLKLESRLSGDGAINNGFQFRSRQLPDGDVCGYQVDNNLDTPWLVRLYDEYGRHDLALRGQHTTFAADSSRQTVALPEGEGDPWFDLGEWHEYHLTCIGNTIELRIDGRLAAVVEDNDPRRAEPQGILALQLHSGPPTRVQFRNIRVKVHKPAVQYTAVMSNIRALQRLAILNEAMAWWPLDAGAHGIDPPLRHVPAFYEFELNVNATGPGAEPGAKVTAMQGAHFEAPAHVQADGDRMSVYIRLQDPRGAWDAHIVSKAGSDATHLSLFGSDTDGDGTQDIILEAGTESQVGRVHFPVDAIDPVAWHDIVGVYDSASLTLYCDGEAMATAPLSGNLIQTESPLIVAGKMAGNEIVRKFHGDLAGVAIWSRALSPDEVARISR